MRMRRRRGAILCGLSGLALLIGGCGSSATHTESSTATQASVTATTSTTKPPSTTAKKEKLPVVSLPLKVPIKGTVLPARYTCDGADISMPFSWSEIPASTAEIDLFIFNTQPVNGKLAADWALAGLKPTLKSIPAGHTPAGAVVGRNQFGQTRYSLCPHKGSKTAYVVLLDPLPHKIAVKPGFDPEALVNKVVHEAELEGRLGFTYTRP